MYMMNIMIVILCPNNKILKYSTTNRDGYREYKSNAMIAKLVNM